MSEEMVADPKFDAAMERLDLETALRLKPSKLLHAAVDLLEKGWCQGQMGKQGHAVLSTEAFQPGVEIDEVCLMGALLKAAVDLSGVGYSMAPGWASVRPDETPERKAMLASYQDAEIKVQFEIQKRLALGMGYMPTATWNDMKTRTQAEVVAVVRAVAVSEQEAGR